MTGRAVLRALQRQIDARATAMVVPAHRHTGCTLQFVGLDPETLTLTTLDSTPARPLRRDGVVTVTFRDGHRTACFLAHVTALEEDGTVIVTRPKQILARDQRRSPRTTLSPQRRLWARLEHAGGSLRGLTVDVSEHGLGLQLEEGPPMPAVGDAIEADLQLVSGRLRLSGTVMNVNGRRCGIRTDDVYAGEAAVAEQVSREFREWSRPTPVEA